MGEEKVEIRIDLVIGAELPMSNPQIWVRKKGNLIWVLTR